MVGRTDRSRARVGYIYVYMLYTYIYIRLDGSGHIGDGGHGRKWTHWNGG